MQNQIYLYKIYYTFIADYSVIFENSPCIVIKKEMTLSLEKKWDKLQYDIINRVYFRFDEFSTTTQYCIIEFLAILSYFSRLKYRKMKIFSI